MTQFENEFLFQCIFGGKLIGNGIERPEAVESRVWSMFKELKDNKNTVVFGHSGVFQFIAKKMQITNL